MFNQTVVNEIQECFTSVLVSRRIKLLIGREPGREMLLMLLIHTSAYFALVTEDTTVTLRVNQRSIECQSRSWSQRGTKVHGSRHGDNPLLKTTGSCRNPDGIDNAAP